MKKLLVIIVAIASLSVQADENPEAFYRAEDGKTTVSGGVYFVKQEAERDLGSTTSKTTTSRTSYVVNAEYGINNDMAVGTTLVHHNLNGESGLGGYTFFLKGQFESFFYQAWANISPGKSDDDNFYDGGNNISLMGGYKFNDNFGAFINFAPSYDYEFEDDDADYTSGSAMSYVVYYERVVHNMTMLLIGSYSTKIANEEDGKAMSKDSQSAIFSAQLVKDFGMFEFLPSFTYSNYLGEDDDLTMTTTTLGLHLRKSF